MRVVKTVEELALNEKKILYMCNTCLLYTSDAADE